MAKRFIIYVLVVTIVSLTYADDENNSQDGDSFASLAQVCVLGRVFPSL